MVGRSQLRCRDALADVGPERLVKRVHKSEMEGSRGSKRTTKKRWTHNFKQ